MGTARSSAPGWVSHAVFWHVYPLGFTGAEQSTVDSVRHRLRGLVDWLDYAVELGASGLALGPIFHAETHGYDTIDHFRIDPRLGDADDFAALVSAAHDRGLKVLLDGVFNHVGRGFPAFVKALAGPGAPEADWFRLQWTDAAEPAYDTFEGHRNLVALNHDNPAVADHVVRVMCHWLAAGADGWRLDAAYSVPRAFWAAVLPRVKAEHPDAYLVGEVIHGDYGAIVAETGLDAVTQYELWKAIWSSLNDRNFYELAWSMDRHNGFLDSFVPLTFVGNHDVTRLASKLTDERALPHALAILCTLGGTPAVYYGDEQAFRGVKEERAGGDDAIRPAFPATPGDLAPYGWPVYRLHQDLIGLRRRHPWLHTARSKVSTLTNTTMVYEAGDRLTVALSIADRATRHEVPGGRTVLAGTGTLAGTRLTLPPYGWAILG
jgi:cyclomaltodextrinase / maltogenic alpha-amylase / neopullulanase